VEPCHEGRERARRLTIQATATIAWVLEDGLGAERPERQREPDLPAEAPADVAADGPENHPPGKDR
jgi:hypothetical protein